MKSIKCHRNDTGDDDDDDDDDDDNDAIMAYWRKDNIVSLNKGKSCLSTKYRKGTIYSPNIFRFANR